MVAAFLKATLGSPQNAWHITPKLQRDGKTPTIVTEPNLGDVEECAYRMGILGEIYGYGRNENLFAGFPPEGEVRWVRAVLVREDMARLRYLKIAAWEDLSGGTRQVVDGARAFAAGRRDSRILGEMILGISNVIRSGAALAEPIMVAVDQHATLILLDGHHRFTAYFMEERTMPRELSAIVGLSDRLSKWDFY